jgi:hypothetical protein
MAGGITFGGQVVHSSEGGDDSSKKIEIPFSDPNFLQKAANKKPQSTFDYLSSIISGFAEGAYSWPFDFSLCLHWIAGSAGFYGGQIKTNCDYHRDRIISLMSQAGSLTYYLIVRGILWKLLNNEQARQIIKKELGDLEIADEFMNRLPNLLHSGSRMTGRYLSGKAFTEWMESGGRIKGKASKGKSLAIGTFNFFALCWGASLHASIKNPRDFDVITIFVSIITGDPNYQLSDEEYKALYRIAMRASEAALSTVDNQKDYQTYKEFIQVLIRFGRTGGKL